MDSSRKALHSLHKFLHESYPCDVLTLCRKGEKHPVFPHKDGQWTWELFAEKVNNASAASPSSQPRDLLQARGASVAYSRVLETYDVGILLHELCVIDVDSVARAAELEATFPELRQAPTEATAHGRHYFFLRSNRADLDGYYDGPAQRERGVDFKTRCSTGTRGFLVVTPSTGKSWIRPLWSTPLLPISDALLDAVAHARPSVAHARPELKPLRIAFPAGAGGVDTSAVVVTDAAELQLLMHVSYFDPFMHVAHDDLHVAHDHAHEEVVIVPVSNAQTFQELLFAMQHGVTRAFPTSPLIQDMVVLADYLGVCNRLLRFLRPLGPVYRYMDIEATFPGLGVELHRTRLYLLHRRKLLPCAPPGWKGTLSCTQETLTALSAKAPGVVLSEPPPDGRWLFPWARFPCTTGYELRSEPLVIEPIGTWLKAYPGTLVLAGGGALHAVLNRGESDDESESYDDEYNNGQHEPHEPSDYDLFVASNDSIVAQQILMDISATAGVEFVHQSQNAVTFLVHKEWLVQVILRLHEDVEHILLTFDQGPCKVAVTSDAQGRCSAVALPAFFWAVANQTNVIDAETWGATSLPRLFKYAHKGFVPFLPCVDRAYMLKSSSRDDARWKKKKTQTALEESKLYGVGYAFTCEASLSMYNMTTVDTIQPAWLKELFLGHPENDYGTLKKITGTLKYVFMHIHKLILCGREADLTRHKNLQLYQQHAQASLAERTAEAWTPAPFTDNRLPRPQKWSKFYDIQGWLHGYAPRHLPWLLELESVRGLMGIM